MGMQYTDTVVTGSGLRGTALSIHVLAVDDTTGPEVAGTRWYRCSQCGMAFPRKEIVFWRGTPWGIPCGDYTDIVQLAKARDTSVVR